MYNRSEGLGVASLDLFVSGALSSNPVNKFQADAMGLKRLTAGSLASAFQVTDNNPLVGVEGRVGLLQRLGQVCETRSDIFGAKDKASCRPGYLLDYLLKSAKSQGDEQVVHIDVLWDVVVDGLSGIWPATRTAIDGVSLGDVWPCKAAEIISKERPECFKDIVSGAAGFVCFHKLSQWLTYSLMEPLLEAQVRFEGVEGLTGLAEYRNGGLYVDAGVISLKEAVASKFAPGQIPRFEVYDDAVVEWRALTVALIDKTAVLVREKLGLTEKELPLAKILEAGITSVFLQLGTWKAGREYAAELRPLTKGPPIEIISDGTVF